MHFPLTSFKWRNVTGHHHIIHYVISFTADYHNE